MSKVQQSARFSKWLRDLGDRLARARILTRIDRLRDGNQGDCRAVGDGISELRIHHGPGYRVYFVCIGEEVFLLLCGGDKSTQAADIATAKAEALAVRSALQSPEPTQAKGKRTRAGE